MSYEVINLGTNSNPQNINLGTKCTPNERSDLVCLFKQYKDVFSWGYGDLKNFDPKIMQHIIPIKPQSKPFQQKLRNMHPSLEPIVKSEVNKLLTTKIIFLVHHTQWVANVVPFMKNNDDSRLCVDFRNLNKAFDKDNYLFPPMDKILKWVSGSEMVSLLDGFLGYNQVLVAFVDQLKTTFITQWGTFTSKNIPFGLINVGATF